MKNIKMVENCTHNKTKTTFFLINNNKKTVQKFEQNEILIKM